MASVNINSPHSLSKTNITINQLTIQGGDIGYVLTSGENGEAIWTDPNTVRTGFYRKLGILQDPIVDEGICIARWSENNLDKYLVSRYDYSELATTKFAWSNVTSTACGATSQSNGNVNSISISAQSGHTNSAAYRCLQINTPGYLSSYYVDDWFLPSIWQFRTMYKNLSSIEWPQGGGLFRYDAFGDTSTVYWTSTENSATTAWAMDIITGAFAVYAKTTLLKIRPFRIGTQVETFAGE